MILEYITRVTINSIVALFIFKLYFFLTSQNLQKVAYLASFIQDSFLIVCNYYLFKLLKSKSLFFTILLILIFVSFIYTIYLFDLLSFSINIFRLNFDIMMFFSQYFVSIKFLISIIIFFILLLIVSKKIPDYSIIKKSQTAILVISFVLFAFTLMRPSINPILYSISQELKMLFPNNKSSNIKKLQAPQKKPNLQSQFRSLHKKYKNTYKIDTKYKKIIVLVMEGITYSEFINQSKKDKDSFLNNYSNYSIFTNYYTNNLDSYTSLLSMLTGIFIPYQAYKEEDKFQFINNTDNIVRILKQNNFQTYFVTSYGIQQKRFTPVIQDWDQTIYMSDDNIDNSKFQCIKSNKIEYSCEDLAVFDDLKNIIKKNESSFILQEMVFGHSKKWEGLSGINPTKYYNNYINKLINTQLLDDSLLIILSDHGQRDDATKKTNYHIPLIFWSKDMKKQNNNKFYSNIDFRDILLTKLDKKYQLPQQNETFTIGHSGELVYGKIDNKNYLFINNEYLSVKTNLNDDKIIEKFNNEFNLYRDYFESLRDDSNIND
jgi:glucan phosphoethanolaminetransferase (alkaline phosphatase superfamily)